MVRHGRQAHISSAQAPLSYLTSLIKCTFKDEIMNSFETSAAELLIKCKALCVCIGHTPMKPALVIGFYLITKQKESSTVQLWNQIWRNLDLKKHYIVTEGNQETVILTIEERLCIRTFFVLYSFKSWLRPLGFKYLFSASLILAYTFSFIAILTLTYMVICVVCFLLDYNFFVVTILVRSMLSGHLIPLFNINWPSTY